MAQYQNHVSFSFLVGGAYAVIGYSFFNIYPENLLLALAVFVVAGMLPDLDASQGAPARELAGLLAAVSPVLAFEHYPALRTGGITRFALVIIGCYVIARLAVIWSLQKFTKHRGMFHSIPAAIILFEIVYLILGDLYWVERMFIAGAAFCGYLSHLFLDGYGNLDIIGSISGKSTSSQPALKLVAPTWGMTFVLYLVVSSLGYMVVKDFYPHKLAQAASRVTNAKK